MSKDGIYDSINDIEKLEFLEKTITKEDLVINDILEQIQELKKEICCLRHGLANLRKEMLNRTQLTDIIDNH